MEQNFTMLQQIHQYVHKINIIKTKCIRVQRDRWSNEEDAILFDGVRIYGNHDYDALAALIVSKTSSQVYQRLRYLRDTLNSFTPQIALQQQ
ncbi:SANT/Myb_domain [Hexamita inflata]|uniref:SANT/Myb domain n=1 Tax=Hexamita inflata TaxID=28002 RepID=A0AA86Q2W4_9EUKA|nr:SANT/Myb domain [Hexamita inflata]CAI9950243.1 SANT/Myb domain [Hexamita inflata]